LSPVETPAQDLLFVYGNEQPQESLPTNKKIVRSHAMKSSWRTRKQSESNLALMKRAITPLLAPKTLTDQHTYGSESSTVLSTSGASSCQAIERPQRGMQDYVPSVAGATKRKAPALGKNRHLSPKTGARRTLPSDKIRKRNDQMFHSLHVPSLIGSSSFSSDPFDSYPVAAQPYMHKLVHHCTSSLLPQSYLRCCKAYL